MARYTGKSNKDIMLTGCSGLGPSMTKGNNNLKRAEGNNNSRLVKGNNDTCISIPCHSQSQTRESRNKDIMPLDSRIKYENDNLESSFCHSGLRAGIQRGDNLMPKAFRFAQSGRSMVEMLGTLAIIGVLSIGGIMGYSYAVDKYHANQIMNDVNLRGIDLIAQASRGGDFSLAEWPTKTSGDLDIGLEVDEATNTTEGGIYVDKVPQRVCKIMAESIPDNVELTVNGVDYTDSCAEENKMVFYYDAVAEALGGGKGEKCNGPVSADGTCTPCEGGTWNETEGQCMCPNGCPLEAPVSSSGVFDCVICPRGGISNGCECSGCPENYWLDDWSDSAGYGDLYCRPCPEGSTSPGGFVEECTCSDGKKFIGCKYSGGYSGCFPSTTDPIEVCGDFF